MSLNRARVALIILCSCWLIAACNAQRQRQKLTIVGPLSGIFWPLYIANEAHYYDEAGLNVRLVFANHPLDVAMLVSGQADVCLTTLDQFMELAPIKPDIVGFGSPVKTWLFALIARKDIHSAAGLKGKRIGVTQLGGNTYTYALRLLSVLGMRNEVDWVPLGDSSRAAALVSGRVDATILGAPSYFALISSGFNEIANLADRPEIDTTTVLVVTRDTLQRRPNLPELLLRANALAVKRFYDDKAFAISAYQKYDNQDRAGLEKTYEIYSRAQSLRKLPYITDSAIRYVKANSEDRSLTKKMTAFDYRNVVENRAIDHLASQGFFEAVFGNDITVSAARRN
jgi:ABC-type nitrate/sulfonate/bicarbonate transport system substrate-binding protein